MRSRRNPPPPQPVPPDLQQLGLKARTANAAESFGHLTQFVDSCEVEVTGSAFLFGNDIRIGATNAPLHTFGLLRSALETWWYVDAPSALRYKLWYSRPGLVATLVEGTPTTGTKVVGAVPLVRVGSSRAVQVLGEFPQCGIALPASALAYLGVLPTVGIPGCHVAAGTKPASLKGVAGYTALFNPGVPGPLYLTVTWQSPFQGASLPQMPTPVYIYFRASDLLGTGLSGASGTAIRLGDLSLLTTPVSIAFAINHNVFEVGYFFPNAELEANIALPPAANSYGVLDVHASELLVPKSAPASGAGIDVVLGSTRPILPGTGYGFLETKVGSGG